jgi:YfiH family protein
MLMQSHDNLRLMHFELLGSCDGFVHAVTTRMAACSQKAAFDLAWSPGDKPGPVRSRIAAVARALNADSDRVCCARQVHGSGVHCIDVLPDPDPGAPCRVCGESDALITGRTGILLMIRVADCVPIVLYDPVRRIAAVVHAGWKGTVAGVAQATVACMADVYGCSPRDILAGIGPAIGPCCFAVGDNVAEQFRRSSFGDSCMVSASDNNTCIDLSGANRTALLRSGLEPGHIEMSGYCTACSRDVFFSHRGEKGSAGRFGLFAGLRS